VSAAKRETNPMTTTVIDLIRHGEPEGGQMFRGSKDDPLSNLGWQQMKAAIADDDHWDAIVSSPMQRCRRFAQQLAEEHKIPLHIEEDLREIGFGEWEGLTAEQIQKRYGDHLNHFWQDPINFLQVFSREEQENLRSGKGRLLTRCQVPNDSQSHHQDDTCVPDRRRRRHSHQHMPMKKVAYSRESGVFEDFNETR